MTSWLAFTSVALAAGAMTALRLWPSALNATVTRGAAGGLGAPVSQIVQAAWSWDGLILACAAVGVVMAVVKSDGPGRWPLAATLTLAGLAVPAYQAHIGVAWALDKHMSAGTWLMAIAAGYGVSRLIIPLKAGSRRFVATALLAFPAITGFWYAQNTFHFWPNTTKVMAAVRLAASSDKGPVLVSTGNNSDSSIERYYLMSGSDWQQWHEGGTPAQLAASAYAVVVLELNATLNSTELPARRGLQAPIARTGNSSAGCLEQSRRVCPRARTGDKPAI